MDDDELALDFYSAGVPVYAEFAMTIRDLREILTLSGERSLQRKVREVVLIGAVGYFEAFCKDHFAALLNQQTTAAADLIIGRVFV